jgi:ADP-heptose:LPS heptosyltransferase
VSLLIIKLSALGDVIQAEGAIHDIRLHHPQEHITVLTMPRFRTLMERCPWVDEVVCDSRPPRWNLAAMWRLRHFFHSRKFDRIYDLQQAGRTKFYYRWLSPGGEWFGNASGCALFRERPKGTSALDHFHDALQAAGIPAKHTLHPDVSWMAEDVDKILDREGLQAGYVLLIPGASAAHPQKRWPYFAELAKKLLDRGLTPVTVPGPDELELCRTLPGRMLIPPGGGWYDYFFLAGFIRRAAFIVGNDTGPTHIAADLGGKGLALFSGHATPESTGITHSALTILQKEKLADLNVEEVEECLVHTFLSD